jgi:molybdopterin-containing oxidoreductase family membrane subunit
MEAFFAWYSANEFERFMIINRTTGPYWFMYWTLIFCNGLVPQLLWIRKIRLNVGILFLISIIVNIGMWLERYVIIVTSLHRDFLPSSWGMYQGSRWDWSFYLGTIGLFLTLFYLFIRVLPMIAIFEMRMLLPGSHAHKEVLEEAGARDIRDSGLPAVEDEG